MRVREVAGRAGELVAGGALVPDGPHTRGTRTFADYLDTLAPRPGAAPGATGA